MKKLIISAALTGAMTPKSACPNLPVTPEEIAKDAVACAKAGAAVVHIHVRNEDLQYTMETEKFEEVVKAIQAECQKEDVDLIVNLTTSNGPGTDEIRLAHLKSIQPEMCSYDSGTLNWGPTVFENTKGFLEKLGTVTQELNIKPEIEVFNAGMIQEAISLNKRGFLKSPMHFQFIMGEPGYHTTPGNVQFLLDKIPEGSTWSLSGIGKDHMPAMLIGLSAGCDGLRVGLEDNIYLEKGVLATNVQLVERAVTLAKLAGREIATAQEARELLGITKKSLVNREGN